MNKTLLTTTDYEKIIEFTTRISRPVTNIRFTILTELANIFGYNNAILWKADNEGNITEPEIYLVSEKSLNEYLEVYHQYDILNPKKNIDLFRTQKTVHISDVLTENNYQNSYYYNYFMRNYGLYDEMGIALVCEGNVVGILGLAQTGNSFLFTKKELQRFQYLSNIIGNILARKDKGEMDYSLLSNREIEIVNLLKEGKTNHSISKELHISVNTVKKHLQNIYQKHAVQNRTHLIQKLLK